MPPLRQDPRPGLSDLLGLLAEGYDMLEVRTSADELKVFLKKGSIRVTLALGREDAARILADAELFH